MKTGSGIRWDIAHRKRGSESTAIMEALMRSASQAHIEMPLNRALVDMIHEIESGERPLKDENLDELAAAVRQHGA